MSAKTNTPCILCRHCRLFAKATASGTGPVYLRVRCARGRWKGPNGRPQTHHLYRVRDVAVPDCGEFKTMCDARENPAEVRGFIEATLPETRVVCGGRG